MAASDALKALRDGLWIIDTTRRSGFITTSMVATAPGWDRVRAWRYIQALAEIGWLERGERRRYYLGPVVRQFAIDWNA